eukprot:UN04464
MLSKIGYKIKRIPFIPMSGFKGDNLSKVSENMKWWKGFKVKIKKKEITGVTLIDALDRVIKQPKRAKNKPFRMPVSGIYKIDGVGNVITGRIEQGTIAPGVMVKFYPTGCGGEAFSLEMHHKKVDVAECGDNIGVNVKKLKKTNMPHVGDVMTIDDKKVDSNPPQNAESFKALVFVPDHPGKLQAAHLEKIKLPTCHC